MYTSVLLPKVPIFGPIMASLPRLQLQLKTVIHYQVGSCHRSQIQVLSRQCLAVYNIARSSVIVLAIIINMLFLYL